MENQKRDALLKKLREIIGGAYTFACDSHPAAEEALLAYLNDPEITALWKEAEQSQIWHY